MTSKVYSYIVRLSMAVFLVACSQTKGDIDMLPSIDLMLKDSATTFNTNEIPSSGPIIFIYFSPTCKNCRSETELLIQNINKLKNVYICFVTNASFEKMRQFDLKYNISGHTNMLLANDYKFVFRRTFNPNRTPYTYVYNKRRKLSAVFSGKPQIETLITVANKILTDQKNQ